VGIGSFHPAGAMTKLSIVIPVYNAEETLPPLWEAVREICRREGIEFEVIFVDDGSQDRSLQVLRRLAAEHPGQVVPIELMRNFGQHNALLCGIRAARYQTIVTMDDDLQNPPAEIPALLRKLDEGYDVVYGTSAQGQHGLLRNLASRVTKIALQSVMGAEIARQVTAFRAFRTVLRRAFEAYQGPFVSIDVLLTWGTTKFGSVPVRMDPRRAGQSGYTVRKLVTHAVNMMTGFSVRPLQLASLAGFSVMAFGVVVLVYVVVRAVVEGSPPGFPFLASIIAIFSGVQLFSLGVIGEYLSRMHFRLMDRPSYAIRERRERPRDPA
jgi:undecaprenyl-phosphate 4-deoxy-4-formamido-L-arabinose transferase